MKKIILSLMIIPISLFAFMDIIIGNDFNEKGYKKTEYVIIEDRQERFFLMKEFADITIGEGPKEFFLFYSPGCPHCSHFIKKTLKNNNLNKYTFYVILIDLPFYKDDIPHITQIIQSEDKITTLLSKQKLGFWEKNKDIEEKLKKNKKLMKRLDVRGVPTLIYNV